MDKICLLAVRNYGGALEYVKNQTDKMCLIAVKNWGWNLYYVKNQTEEICIEAVKQNGSSLQYVNKQTPKLCLEAVKQNGSALDYVNWIELKGKFSKEQLYEICIEAVKQNGLAIQYIEEQTDEICREALKQNICAIKYVNAKEKYLDEFGVKYLEKQGKAREVFAVKRYNKWLFTVGCQNNITKEKFINRIYNTDGGFDKEKGVNVHRQTYVDFLKEFE
ncbi:DUF4116 domain-containing protein [Clostridioides difficile]|nr:DUF4116 domain-containing protein [Clostridioides difficile]